MLGPRNVTIMDIRQAGFARRYNRLAPVLRRFGWAHPYCSVALSLHGM